MHDRASSPGSSGRLQPHSALMRLIRRDRTGPGVSFTIKNTGSRYGVAQATLGLE